MGNERGQALIILLFLLGLAAATCANAANCLEDTENTNGNSVYVKPSRFPTSNDRMAVSCPVASPCATVP